MVMAVTVVVAIMTIKIIFSLNMKIKEHIYQLEDIKLSLIIIFYQDAR